MNDRLHQPGPLKSDTVAPPHDCERVAERLRVLADVIETMRAAVPAGVRQNWPREASRQIASAHDDMVTKFMVWAGSFVAPLSLDIPEERYNEPGCMTFVAVWNGKAETQESRNAENEEQLELERAENEGLANWHRERTGHDEREDEGVS